MRRIFKSMFQKYAWAMLVLIPIVVAVVSWLVTGAILEAMAFSDSLSETISLSIAAFLGILSYVGIALGEVLTA